MKCAVVLVLSLLPKALAGQAGLAYLAQWRLVEPVTLRGASLPDGGFTRVVGACRMPSGEIVVAEASMQALVVFERTGAFRTILGRRGQGPGEFSALWAVSARGDTITAIERSPGPNQVHKFFAGEFIERSLLQSKDSALNLIPLAFSPRGGFMVARGTAMRPITQARKGVWRDTLEVGVAAGDVSALSWIGKFPQATFGHYPLKSGPVSQGVTTVLSAGAFVAGGTATRLWFGDSESGTLMSIEGRGRSPKQIAWPLATRNLSPEAVSRAATRVLGEARTADDSARLRARIGVGLPLSRAPHFTRLVSSTGSAIWVEVFTEDPQDAKTYLVFAETGQWIAQVRVPEGSTVLAVDDDHAVLMHTDADGLIELTVSSIQGKKR